MPGFGIILKFDIESKNTKLPQKTIKTLFHFSRDTFVLFN